MSGSPKRQFSLAYLTVLGTPPRRMVEIAAETGYDFVSLRLSPVTPDEPRFPFTTDPKLVADTVKAMQENGISLLDVELIRTDPGTSVDDFKPFVEVAAQMDARHIITQIPVPDRRLAITRFQEVCDLAAPFGLTVDLEFLPWSPTFGLHDAVDIVTKSARPNAGILIDTLHFSRSQSSIHELAGLSRELFNVVQLCDAQAPASISEEELIRVARSERSPAGGGDILLQPILQALPTVPYALEVPNDIRRQDLGTVEFSRYVLAATKKYFDIVEADEVAANA